MQVNSEKGTHSSKTTRLEILVNYCRTVVRPDEDLLKLAMGQYEQFLQSQQRR